MFTRISIPRRNASRPATSMKSSRATRTASAQRGSSSWYQQAMTPQRTSRRSTIGSSSVPKRLYWPVTRAAMPSK